MKTAKEYYEEYKNSHPSATWKLDKMYEDAFEKGKESEAIEFVDWVANGYWHQPLNSNKWKKDDDDELYTTKELYEIFKSSLQKQLDNANGNT